MYERNFHLENLTIQLGQFTAFLDTSNISVTKFFESLVNFGKTENQKNIVAWSNQTRKTCSCPTCNQRAKWTVIFSSEMCQNVFKKYFKWNRLNHCMLLHVHCKKTDQLNMIELTKRFVGDKQDCKAARLQDCNQAKHLAGFRFYLSHK